MMRIGKEQSAINAVIAWFAAYYRYQFVCPWQSYISQDKPVNDKSDIVADKVWLFWFLLFGNKILMIGKYPLKAW